MRVQSTYTHRNFHNYHISYGVKFSLTLLAASLFAALETNAATINLPGQSPAELGKLCKIRNFSQSPFGGFIFEESDGNFPSGRN